MAMTDGALPLTLHLSHSLAQCETAHFAKFRRRLCHPTHSIHFATHTTYGLFPKIVRMRFVHSLITGRAATVLQPPSQHSFYKLALC